LSSFCTEKNMNSNGFTINYNTNTR
jgi:hypothetical protein